MQCGTFTCSGWHVNYLYKVEHYYTVYDDQADIHTRIGLYTCAYSRTHARTQKHPHAHTHDYFKNLSPVLWLYFVS